MKMQTSCIKCHTRFYIEIDEDFFQGKKVRCPCSHEYYFFPDSPRYPFLFQLSVHAMNAGFYLEAFHALYSGFESFKETFVGACHYNSCKDITTTEKLMKRINRSEKIDGAFNSAYLQEFGEIPDRMSMGSSEERNLIVHTGKLPTREFIIKLGNCFFLQALKIQTKLEEKYEINEPFLSYIQQRTLNKVQEQGFKLSEDRLNKRYILQALAITVISPNAAMEETVEHPYEFYLNDPDSLKTFNQIFVN